MLTNTVSECFFHDSQPSKQHIQEQQGLQFFVLSGEACRILSMALGHPTSTAQKRDLSSSNFHKAIASPLLTCNYSSWWLPLWLYKLCANLALAKKKYAPQSSYLSLTIRSLTTVLPSIKKGSISGRIESK